MRHLIRRAVLIGRPLAHRFPANSAPSTATGGSLEALFESVRDISTPSNFSFSSAAQQQPSEEHPTRPSSHDIHILLKEDHNAPAPNLSLDHYESLVAKLEGRYEDIISGERSESDRIGQIAKMSKFILDCSSLWGSGNEAPLNCISRGAHLAHKLIHILLKSKEEEIAKGISSLNTEGDSIQIDIAKGMRTDFQFLCIMALSGLARSDINDRGERAQAIVDRLEDLYANSGNQEHLAPISRMYNLALVAYAKSGSGEDDIVDAENIQKFIALMDRMKKPGAPVKPDGISYNILLDAYSRLGDAKGAQRVLEELEGVWERSGGNDELMPDVVSYSSVLSAWERSGDPSAAQKAEAILLRMVELYQKTGDKRVAPNQFTFGTCIALHAHTSNHHDRNNVENAERMLDWLVQIHRESEYSEETAPNGSHFASVLNGWSKSRRHDAAIRAEETLQKMESLYNETGSLSLKPNHQCFVFCVDAWARSNHRDAAKNAERILNKMEGLFLDDSVDENDRMNNFAYNILTSLWAKIGRQGSSDRIRDIIHRLTEISDQTNNEGLAPDKFTYTSLMRALVNEKAPGNLEKCVAVLDRMEDFAERTGKESVMPDEMAYATIMNGYSKDGNVQKIESLIRRMKQKKIHCTNMVYNILLNAIVTSKAYDVGERAEEIMKRMEEESANGNIDCRPSLVSYITYLSALSRSGSPDKIARATKVFEEIVQRFESGDEAFRPSDRVLGSLLNVIAKSNEPRKVSMCLDFIGRMKKDYATTPNRVAYNIVLSACAHHTDPSDNMELRREVLKVAVSTFQLLSKDGSLGGPDSSSYRSLLFIVDSFIQDEEERMASVEDLWNKCCNDGQVNQWVLQALFKVSGPHFWRLVGKDRRNGGIVRIKDLPSEWSRNVKVRESPAASRHRQKKRRGAPRREQQRNWR